VSEKEKGKREGVIRACKKKEQKKKEFGGGKLRQLNG